MNNERKLYENKILELAAEVAAAKKDLFETGLQHEQRFRSQL